MGFQIFQKLFAWVPSQWKDEQNDIWAFSIRSSELVQILDAPKVKIRVLEQSND